MKRVRILLADDNPAVLEHAAAILAPEFELIARLPDGEGVLREYDRLQPDVIVLDISMGQLSGIEVARRLRDTGRSAKIVFLTVHDDEDFVSAALGAGGLGYVVKSRMNAELLPAIHAALEGEIFVGHRH